MNAQTKMSYFGSNYEKTKDFISYNHKLLFFMTSCPIYIIMLTTFKQLKA